MDNYLLRNGKESDRNALQDLLASYKMEADIAPDEFLFAEVDGRVVGAARLEYEEEAAYLRPIVVASEWQGKNIGSVLVERIVQGLQVLHVVARGKAAGFYRSLGFLPMTWEEVPERYRQECQTCPDLQECRPLPMVLTRSTDMEIITPKQEKPIVIF